MENKYYTPKIEEFRVGVECQVYYPRKEIWKDRKIRTSEETLKKALEEYENNKN